MECWKQRRQEKLWKKVSSFVLFPASQLPNPFGPASSLPCFLHNRNMRVWFYVRVPYCYADTLYQNVITDAP